MIVQLSKRIKQLRQNKNLTQTDLAKDICSQGLISKIEKGEISPDILILSRLAKRLDVSVGYLIGEETASGVSVLNDERPRQYKEKIAQLVTKQNYLELEDYVAHNKMRDYSLFEYDSPYFMWLDSLIRSMNYHKLEEAIQSIKDGLDVLNDSNHLSQDDLDLKFNLYDTWSCILALEGKFQEAIEISLNCYAMTEFPRVNPFIKIQLFYGVARSYAKLKQAIDSNFYIQKAIQVSTKSANFLLLEKLYLLSAENYLSLNDLERAKEFAEKSKFISDIKNYDTLVPYIEKVLSKIKEIETHS